jgi:hypothetical protein
MRRPLSNRPPILRRSSACGGKNTRVLSFTDLRRNPNREFAKNNNRMRGEA